MEQQTTLKTNDTSKAKVVSNQWCANAILTGIGAAAMIMLFLL